MDDTNSPQDTLATASEAAQRIKDAGLSAVDQTKQAAQTALSDGAGKVADGTQAAAQGLRRTADEMPQEQAWIGAALRKSADGLEKASQAISDGNLENGMRDLGDFARRQPALFLGAAFALGFALSRVGKTAISKVADGASDQQAGNMRDSTSFIPPISRDADARTLIAGADQGFGGQSRRSHAQ
jgi:uncharacterized phage infection (PIP) family protein YhgE